MAICKLTLAHFHRKYRVKGCDNTGLKKINSSNRFFSEASMPNLQWKSSVGFDFAVLSLYLMSEQPELYICQGQNTLGKKYLSIKVVDLGYPKIFPLFNFF